MATYVNSPDSSNIRTIEDCIHAHTQSASHTDIALVENGTKYRKPFLYVDDFPEATKDINIIDASGNDLEVYGDSSWLPMGEDGLLDMFGELNDFKEGTDRVDWDKVDYEVWGEDWYREKYPHFPDEFYALLVKASEKKFEDLQKGNEKGLTRTKGEFTVNFD